MVVHGYTVSYPWAVMVHLENAFVALRAVVTPVRLGPETPLAHPDASILFPFERFESDVWFLGYEGLLLADLIFLPVQRTGLGFDILVVEVGRLLGVLLVFLYFLVCEVPILLLKRVCGYLLYLL